MGIPMDNEETLQRIAVAEYYNQPGSRVALKDALEKVSEASAFLLYCADSLTPMECSDLTRALSLLVPTLTPIITRLKS